LNGRRVTRVHMSGLHEVKHVIRGISCGRLYEIP
jgi:hypothetical protein